MSNSVFWPGRAGVATDILGAAAATGAGSTYPCPGCRNFGIQVVLNGGPSTAIVLLEGSIDGANFFTIATWDKAAPLTSGVAVYAVDKPVNYVRANLTTLTGGTTPTVNAYLSGSG